MVELFMSNKHIKIKHFKTLLLLENRILPVVYDGKDSTDMVTYRCDLFKNACYGSGRVFKFIHFYV